MSGLKLVNLYAIQVHDCFGLSKDEWLEWVKERMRELVEMESKSLSEIAFLRSVAEWLDVELDERVARLHVLGVYLVRSEEVRRAIG